MFNQKRCWAEISLDNIEHNYRAIRATLPAGCRFLGVVKADAYGHGAVPVARRLEAAGADYLAVACLEEAMELRDAGIKMPVLILGHTPPEFTPVLIDHDITQAVTCESKAEEYAARAAAHGGTLKVHIKLDTGMSRLGFLCAGPHFSDGVANVASACRLPGLYAEGVFTHFAVSDEPGEANEAYTRRQFRLFTDMLDALEKLHGIRFDIRHCANSGAVLHYKETCLDMARPGLLLYGYGDGGTLGLKPCMRFVSSISTIKHFDAGTDVSYGRTYTTKRVTRAGVLPVGYADGLFRCLSGRCAFATPHGFAPQIGRICMDMCMVDLTELPEDDLGSEVELFGPRVDLETLAEAAGTIPYELLCSVSKRVPRIYPDA